VPSIHIIQGPDKGRRVELSTGGDTTVGRQDCDVDLVDNTVSRRHFRLTQGGGRWVLEDMGSANGTFLNGMKITRPAPVNPGDQIRCGKSLLVFARSGEATGMGGVDLDENGLLVDAAIVATVPSSEDSVIIPTPEAGAEAIGNLRILYDFIAEVGSIFDADVLLTQTLEKVFSVLKADRGFVMLVEEGPADAQGNTERLVLKASKATEAANTTQAPISRTIINEVIRNEVGVLSSNAMGDKRFASGKSVHDFSIRSAICVPIKGREAILGVIHVDCSVSDQTYSTEQLRLLTAIGYQAGLAIENVRLYQAAVQSERLAAVGETVAVLSHHIKNILQALQAGTDAVEAALRNDNVDKANKAWPLVQRGLRRTNELIMNMLAFSNDRRPQREDLNVNAVLEECIEMIGGQADEAQVALMNDLDDLPPLGADSAGLHQAVLNLLNNALDAVEPKRGVVTVRSKYDSVHRNVMIEVIDNGSGIEPERLEEIFKPFYSFKGQQGTGLGLAVAKKIVEEHHGAISVSSTLGEGTTFTITLPTMPSVDAGDTMQGSVN
jgi:signal transduction histidine kinase